MKNFIFVTNEGYTFQPNSSSIEPDIENLQVIGFGEGNNSKEAFDYLLKNSIFRNYKIFRSLVLGAY